MQKYRDKKNINGKERVTTRVWRLVEWMMNYHSKCLATYMVGDIVYCPNKYRETEGVKG